MKQSNIIKHNNREYKKSSFSWKGPFCVGVSIGKDDVSIINTNKKDKVIIFTKKEWQVFLQGVKAGEFDTT